MVRAKIVSADGSAYACSVCGISRCDPFEAEDCCSGVTSANVGNVVSIMPNDPGSVLQGRRVREHWEKFMRGGSAHNAGQAVSAAPGHRTDAEIAHELERRLEEMQREAARPERKYPCATCRFADDNYCANPLIRGFEGAKRNWDAPFSYGRETARLCGVEKALWQPRTVWQRVPGWAVGLGAMILIPLGVGLALYLRFS